MLGDLPDADIPPPENVLFVCKLNPVTEDDDLELIFGRFGDIKSCQARALHDSYSYMTVTAALSPCRLSPCRPRMASGDS